MEVIGVFVEMFFKWVSTIIGMICSAVSNAASDELFWPTVIGFIIFLIVLFLNKKIKRLEQQYFDGTFNTIFGGIWLSTLLCVITFFVPPVNKEVSFFIADLFNLESFSLPPMNSIVFWVVIVICLLVFFGYMIIVIDNSSLSVSATIVYMFGFSLIHTIYLFFMIGLIISALPLAILVFIGIAIVSGGDASYEGHVGQVEADKAKAEAEYQALQRKRESAKQAAIKKYGAHPSEVSVNSDGSKVNVNGRWIDVHEK